MNSLLKGASASDHRKLTEFLDAIRDVERRIQTAEEQSSRELPTVSRPVGIPALYHDHAKLMFDLMVLAYQTDLTRVTSFMMASEQSVKAYPELNQTEAHHALSHNRGDVKKMEECGRINVYHAKQFAYFLNRMRSTPDGDGSLLDHSMIIYGSGLGDGDLHTQHNLPIAVLGGGAGQIKGGRHLQYPKGTPMSNLHVAMLNMAGISVESFGDSTGKLDLNSPAAV